MNLGETVMILGIIGGLKWNQTRIGVRITLTVKWKTREGKTSLRS